MSKNVSAKIPESIVINRHQRVHYLFSDPEETILVLEKFGLSPQTIISNLFSSFKHDHTIESNDLLRWINENKHVFSKIPKLHENIYLNIKNFSEEDLEIVSKIVKSGKDDAISDILPIFFKNGNIFRKPPASFLSDEIFSMLYKSPRWEDWEAAAFMAHQWAPDKIADGIRWADEKNKEMMTRDREPDYFEEKHISGYGPDQENFNNDVDWIQFLVDRLIHAQPGSETHAASIRNILELKDLIIPHYLDILHSRVYRVEDIDVVRLIFENYQEVMTEKYAKIEAALWIIDKYGPISNLEENDMFRFLVTFVNSASKSINGYDFHFEKLISHLMSLLEDKSGKYIFANTDWPLRALSDYFNIPGQNFDINIKNLIFVRNMCPDGEMDTWFAARILREALFCPEENLLMVQHGDQKPHFMMSDSSSVYTKRNFSVQNTWNDSTLWKKAMFALNIDEVSINQLGIAMSVMGVDFKDMANIPLAMDIISSPAKPKIIDDQKIDLPEIKDLLDFH